MPSEVLFDGLSFSDSRDYKGSDFKAYIDPSFYRGEVPNWQGLLTRDQLRTNGELIALNEPDSTEVLDPNRTQLLGFRVSPQIPNGVYKRGTQALVYYWKDGFQYSVSYTLVSLDRINPETLSTQVTESIYSNILQQSSDILKSKFARFVTFGISGQIAPFIDTLQQEVDELDIFAVWVRGGTAIQPIEVVTSKPSGTSVLDDIDVNAENVRSFLPFLVSGFGLATGNPLLIGGGFVLRYLESVKK